MDEIREYSEAWVRTMLMIWREKIERLKVINTGALHESFSSAISSANSEQVLMMKFFQYGIYQAMGVGNGYKHGNGGDLEFLGKEYREKHKLGKARVRRDWFNKKFYMSLMAMKEDVARILGENTAHILASKLT